MSNLLSAGSSTPHARRRWPLFLLFVLTGAGWSGFVLNLLADAPATSPAPVTVAPVPASSDAVPVRPVTPRAALDADESETIDLYTRTSPSVVHITTSVQRRDAFSMNLFNIPQGTGTGFIWDAAGHIVTNFHVIRGATGAEVTLADQSKWPARLVGTAPTKDLAVLKIDAPADKLVAVGMGDSSDLRVGQKVFAIGNPFGFDQTLTTGIISGLGRELDTPDGFVIRDLIQTDAAINPGNSGGPLLDSAGLLIGVNTAIYSPSGAYAGIGLAIPAAEVNRIVPQLIAHGRIVRPGLGVSIVPDHVARRLGVQGVIVADVPAGGPAETAGFRPTQLDEYHRVLLGDVIVAIDGDPVASAQDLYDALEARKPGDSVNVTVSRGRSLANLTATLQQIN